MLIEEIKLSELQSIYLLDKDNLPNCAAIYFVSDSSQVLYIGKTLNLVKRWKDHHRFKQLKRFNKKDRISISWMACANDLNTLLHLEKELIKLFEEEFRSQNSGVRINQSGIQTAGET